MGPLGFTAMGWPAAELSAAGLVAVAVESLAGLVVVVSVVWLLLQAASKARAATGAAQRAEALVQVWRIVRGIRMIEFALYGKLAAIDTELLATSKLLPGFQPHFFRR